MKDITLIKQPVELFKVLKFEGMASSGGEGYFSIGLVNVALNETELAFEAFNKVDDWGPWASLVMRHFFPGAFGPLAGDSRYQELLNKMNRSWTIDR